jgi:hypothetical protein
VSSEKLLTAEEVLDALRNVDSLPSNTGKLRHGEKFRTIYEAGKGQQLRPSGQFFIDYAAYPGGSTGEVPIAVIRELESAGLITAAFPDNPKIKAWVLKP